MTNKVCFKYRVAGVAFEGDPFDYVVESKKTFLDFLTDDLNELAGVGQWEKQGVKTYFTGRPNQVIIHGVQRLYLIEQL